MLISSSLGINAKTAAALQPRGLQRFDPSEKIISKTDVNTGEITFFHQAKDGKLIPKKTTAQIRSNRFALKSVSNQILPDERSAKCCRVRRGFDNVTIQKSKKHQSAHYGNLYTCGSVWMCPVCAAKIAERRRLELISAISNAKDQGLFVYMATFTVPHGLGDDVNTILDKMTSAWRFMTMSRSYKALKLKYSLVGTIRALETTYGSNGFHPHYHVIVFTRFPILLDQFQTDLYLCWLNACSKRSLPIPSLSHGVIVKDGQQAAGYVSKWGLEDEITKGHIKTSKSENGLTPWDMLREVLHDKTSRFRSIFYIYAKAFKGRRQLYWSNGLKALLSIDDISDEDLATQQDDDSILIAEITPEQWRAILKTKSEAATLEVAENSPDSLQQFLTSLIVISENLLLFEREGARPRATTSEIQQTTRIRS